MKMKKKSIILILLLAIAVAVATVFSFLSTAGTAGEEEEGRFRYVLAVFDDKGKVIPVTQKQISGDMMKYGIRIFFQPVNNACLYILLIEKNRGITLIFPDSAPAEFYKTPDNYAEYNIPRKQSLTDFIREGWEYQLHVIFSTKRLKTLEKELNDFLKINEHTAGESPAAAGKKIIYKIEKTLQGILMHADTAPGKQTPKMGTERSAETSLKPYAEEYYFRSSVYEIYSIKK